MNQFLLIAGYECKCSFQNGILSCQNNTIKYVPSEIVYNCRDLINRYGKQVKVLDLQNQNMPIMGTSLWQFFQRGQTELKLPSSKQPCKDVEGVDLC